MLSKNLDQASRLPIRDATVPLVDDPSDIGLCHGPELSPVSLNISHQQKHLRPFCERSI